MDSREPPVILTPAKRRLALFLKIGGIVLLIALLQIPLAMMHGVLVERQGYQAQAIAEIKNTWGQAQLIAGPVLVVPYSVTRHWTREFKDAEGKLKTVEESSVSSNNICLLPTALDVSAEIDPEVRYRGIYEAVVYSAQVVLKGSFKTDLTDIGTTDAVYHWERATVSFGMTDARRLRAAPKLVVGGKTYAVESEPTEGAILGLVAKVPTDGPNQVVDFEVRLDLQGSERLEIAPVGKSTVVQMHSKWTDPSFTGAQLPVSRTISPDGFTANWRMAHYGRAFPQSWNGAYTNVGSTLHKIVEAGYGVAFSQPVNGYSMVERAQKYGVLFFVLVFTVFFLFEIMATLRIHPLQYALVGVALCVFFIGFLALSEFWPTGGAYAAAAAACTLMVSLYAWSFLQAGWRTLVIGGGLSATYGYLYFVLKSQDYALVAGTAALFGALALVMFCTRRINWYELDLPGTENAGAAQR